MGQSTNLTRPRLPHTGKPHGRVNLVELKHDSHEYSTCPWHSNRPEHGHVTRACFYRAQVKSNSKKATFGGS
ncbi:atp-dependent dna helicase mph1 [Gossypium arboreum]|uniref:Atp-dependent dna helicase mph1 n=1 Tax=Gossypium arboreum TaxID=29729 RepID=A0A0B0MJ65_GOSAR|nr:atp-dependent dna helicase mph1 [Gossypium arboreum]